MVLCKTSGFAMVVESFNHEFIGFTALLWLKPSCNCLHFAEISFSASSLQMALPMKKSVMKTKAKTAMINAVEKEWQRMAEEFHLRENRDKAQHARVHLRESMEVLGALVGHPTAEKDIKSKATERMLKSSLKYRRISFLPLKCKDKLFTANIFARSGLEYGWIASNPGQKLLQLQEGWLWKCLGRTKYSSPFMRQVIFGAHSHVQLMLLRKQLRLLVKRNASLYALGLAVTPAPLDKMVEKGLTDLGWIFDGEFWTHPKVELGFKLEDLMEEKHWRKVSHDIRESYRLLAFDCLVASNRHDARGINVQYSSERRKLALQWAGDNFRALMLRRHATYAEKIFPAGIIFGSAIVASYQKTAC